MMPTVANKPAGGLIAERDDWDGPTFAWLPREGKLARPAALAFLSCWLCGWAVGWVVTGRQVLSGNGNLFLYAWLGGWTVGGLGAIWALVNLLRPHRAESVTLNPHAFRHDSGRFPHPWLYPAASSGRGGKAEARRQIENPFTGPGRRKVVEVDRSRLGRFVLERVGERQRLSFDLGADRVEVGGCLGEPEREWLHAVLEHWRTTGELPL